MFCGIVASATLEYIFVEREGLMPRKFALDETAFSKLDNSWRQVGLREILFSNLAKNNT